MTQKDWLEFNRIKEEVEKNTGRLFKTYFMDKDDPKTPYKFEIAFYHNNSGVMFKTFEELKKDYKNWIEEQ